MSFKAIALTPSSISDRSIADSDQLYPESLPSIYDLLFVDDKIYFIQYGAVKVIDLAQEDFKTAISPVSVRSPGGFFVLPQMRLGEVGLRPERIAASEDHLYINHRNSEILRVPLDSDPETLVNRQDNLYVIEDINRGQKIEQIEYYDGKLHLVYEHGLASVVFKEDYSAVELKTCVANGYDQGRVAFQKGVKSFSIADGQVYALFAKNHLHNRFSYCKLDLAAADSQFVPYQLSPIDLAGMIAKPSTVRRQRDNSFLYMSMDVANFAGYPYIFSSINMKFYRLHDDGTINQIDLVDENGEVIEPDSEVASISGYKIYVSAYSEVPARLPNNQFPVYEKYIPKVAYTKNGEVYASSPHKNGQLLKLTAQFPVPPPPKKEFPRGTPAVGERLANGDDPDLFSNKALSVNKIELDKLITADSGPYPLAENPMNFVMDFEIHKDILYIVKRYGFGSYRQSSVVKIDLATDSPLAPDKQLVANWFAGGQEYSRHLPPIPASKTAAPLRDLNIRPTAVSVADDYLYVISGFDRKYGDQYFGGEQYLVRIPLNSSPGTLIPQSDIIYLNPNSEKYPSKSVYDIEYYKDNLYLTGRHSDNQHNLRFTAIRGISSWPGAAKVATNYCQPSVTESQYGRIAINKLDDQVYFLDQLTAKNYCTVELANINSLTSEQLNEDKFATVPINLPGEEQYSKNKYRKDILFIEGHPYIFSGERGIKDALVLYKLLDDGNLLTFNIHESNAALGNASAVYYQNGELYVGFDDANSQLRRFTAQFDVSASD